MLSEYRHGAFLWIAIFITFITFTAYFPALQNGFVNWDDDVLVYKNQNIRFIDYHFLGWAVTDIGTGLWHPFVWFNFAFDYAIWGLNPLGYHLSNTLLHVTNTLLVFILAVLFLRYNKREGSGKAIIAGFITSLFFGIHPLHVESVAWISGRKDVLFGLFFLLSLLTYLRYISSKTLKRHYYITSICLFAFALMSKPMAVTLPAILLLLDFYPFKRLVLRENISIRVFLEKIPFLLLSILSSLITIHAQDLAKVFKPVYLSERLFVAMDNYILYLIKIALPFNLAPFYPYLGKTGHFYIGSLILFLLITFASYMSLKRRKVFFAGWFYYIITLIPVIGFFKIGNFATADRYAYLPSLSIFFLVGLSIATSFNKHSKPVIISFLILLTGILTYKTDRQITVWNDSISLWSHEIKLFPNAFMAYNNRGNAYSNAGNYQQAIKDYNRAVELNPRAAETYFNLGVVYSKVGQVKAARICYNIAAGFGLKQAEDLLRISP